jgi:hypothetical protein
MTYEQFLAVESYLEPAVARLLTDRGVRGVRSPFVRVVGFSPNQEPVLEDLPDEVCWATFTLTRIDPTSRVFAQTAAGDQRSVPGVIEGTIEVFHRVPAGDVNAALAPGSDPACYVRLAQQRGVIRAALCEDADPFAALLPEIDVLEIQIADPEKSVDRERSANQATERFTVRLAPRAGSIVSQF